jgi:hypothetical protein
MKNMIDGVEMKEMIRNPISSASKKMKKKKKRMEEAEEEEGDVKIPSQTAPAKTMWIEHVDETSGFPYWENTVDGSTTWNDPNA